MKTIFFARLCYLAVTSVVLLLSLARPVSAKPFEWQAVAPESEGLSKEKLDALKDELARRKTHTFLVIRNDKIVYEWYATGYGPDKKHGAASLSKATVAGLALALPVDDRVLYREMGCRPRGHVQLPDQVDERRRQDPLLGVFGG